MTKLLNLHNGTPMSWVPRKQFFTYGNYDFQRGTLRNLSLNYSLSYRDAMYYNRNAVADLPCLHAAGPRCFLSSACRLRHRCTGAQCPQCKELHLGADGTQLFPNEPTNALVTLSYKL